MALALIRCAAGDILAATPRAVYRVTFRKRAIAIGRDLANNVRLAIDKIGPTTPTFPLHSEPTLLPDGNLAVVDVRTATNPASATVATLAEKLADCSGVIEPVRIERIGTVGAGGIAELAKGRGVELERASRDAALQPVAAKVGASLGRIGTTAARTLSIVALAAIVLGVVYLSRTAQMRRS